MIGKHSLTSKHIENVLRGRSVSDLLAQMRPDSDSLPKKLPVSAKTTLQRVEKTWQLLPDSALKDTLLNPDDLADYQGNIENLIGTLRLPLGMAGPLRVNGLFAKGDYHIPMATTEASLVASYHRGTSLITEAGGL